MSELARESRLAREVNKIFREGDSIDVIFVGTGATSTGVFIETDDNFLLWVDNDEDALRVAPLNKVAISKNAPV